MGAPHVKNEPGKLWCPVCKQSKDEATEFHRGASLKQGTPCRECANARTREWRKNNPERWRQHSYRNWKQTSARNYAIVNAYKRLHGCCTCGEDDPVCLDFHHLDPTTKRFNIGSKTPHYSKAKLLAEMEKCTVICKNCHAKLHRSTDNDAI